MDTILAVIDINAYLGDLNCTVSDTLELLTFQILVQRKLRSQSQLARNRNGHVPKNHRLAKAKEG